MEISENFVNENVFVSEALPFVKPNKIYYKMLTTSLIEGIGAYVESYSNFGALYGLSRVYGNDKEGNPVDTEVGKFKEGFSNFDYTQKNDKGEVEQNNLLNVKLPTLNFELAQSNIIPMLEKFKSKWTFEAFQDYFNLAKSSEDIDNMEYVIASEFTIELVAQMDARMINLVKKKAQKLTANVGLSNDKSKAVEIVKEIQMAALDSSSVLFASTEIPIFCSKKIAAELMSHQYFHPNFGLKQNFENVYYKGRIGNIHIHVDLFDYIEDDNFVLVCIRDITRFDNASVIFIPRKFSIYDQIDSNDYSKNFFMTFQYGLAFNPSDIISEDNDGDSRLIKYLTIQ